MNIVLILTTNYPGTQWVLTGEEYAGLEWLDETPKPTEEELEAAWPDVQYQVAYDAVVVARQVGYQSTSDPIFMQYQRDEATKQEWLDAVQAVKDANPYPTLEEVQAAAVVAEEPAVVAEEPAIAEEPIVVTEEPIIEDLALAEEPATVTE